MNHIPDNHNFDKLISLLQAEYQSLKAEQTSRIVMRENAFISNFLALGVIATIAYSSNPNNLLILLLIPLISACICWVYLNNDILVSKLTLYFSKVFPEKVIEVYNKDHEQYPRAEILKVIGSWEHFHRKKDKFRKVRKVLNTVFIFLGFILLSIAALTITYSIAFASSMFVIIFWCFDVLLLLIILTALLITKDW